MAPENPVKQITTAIDYIESHLHEKLDLKTVAGAVHYSNYHLHRMFLYTTNITPHEYVRRRRLTEAARLLTDSDRSILEIALLCGYESRQSFTDAFKHMYKKSPNQYREKEIFYPLLLRYTLNENATDTEDENDWRQKITFAENNDISEWMKLVGLVIDGFPHLDEKQYEKRLRESIRNRRALILKDKNTAVGAMAFDETTGNIDFLGIHPQYRKKGIAKAFCEKALYELAHSAAVTVTSFREGDKADTGHRQGFKRLGFAEAELLVEFGYPPQRLILQKEKDGGCPA